MENLFERKENLDVRFMPHAENFTASGHFNYQSPKYTNYPTYFKSSIITVRLELQLCFYYLSRNLVNFLHFFFNFKFVRVPVANFLANFSRNIFFLNFLWLLCLFLLEFYYNYISTFWVVVITVNLLHFFSISNLLKGPRSEFFWQIFQWNIFLNFLDFWFLWSFLWEFYYDCILTTWVFIIFQFQIC